MGIALKKAWMEIGEKGLMQQEIVDAHVKKASVIDWNYDPLIVIGGNTVRDMIVKDIKPTLLECFAKHGRTILIVSHRLARDLEYQIKEEWNWQQVDYHAARNGELISNSAPSFDYINRYGPEYVSAVKEKAAGGSIPFEATLDTSRHMNDDLISGFRESDVEKAFVFALPYERPVFRW